ncbi:MAG: DGQHR domain-containing protein [Thiotrichaceae bacterium]
MTTEPEIIKLDALQTQQLNQSAWLFLLKYKHAVKMSYVARRGVDQEEGAVQRLLNSKRINKIKSFLLNGNVFPNAVIFNWTTEHTFNFANGVLNLPIIEQAAQILDGQHRIEGIKDALKENASLGDIEIPVLMFKNLSTEECARIFLSINTEQQPAPKSLVYDLYSIAFKNKDFALERASDLAEKLNADPDSPYNGWIKFPGNGRQRGGIQLSSIISALKSLVKKDGYFESVELESFDHQYNVLKNYFTVLSEQYGNTWDGTTNPFIFSSGFNAAIEVLMHRLLKKCHHPDNDFSQNKFRELLRIDEKTLIRQSEVKGLSGEKAIAVIREKLENCLISSDKGKPKF